MTPTLCWTKADVARACMKHGSSLLLPGPLQGARLLWAIAGAESSFGQDCAPRYERAYDHGGYYDGPMIEHLLSLYGKDASSSFGPWQVLAINAYPAYTPEQIATDLDAAAIAAVTHIQRWCIGYRDAQTLAQIAQSYNTGTCAGNPAPGALRYCRAVQDYYDNADYPDMGVI